jgi:hypothetical protein
MEQRYGRWLVYLRLTVGGETHVLHVLCDDQDEPDQVLKVATGPASGVHLVEHAVWSSRQTIYTRRTEGVAERELLTYDGFMSIFGDAPADSVSR